MIRDAVEPFELSDEVLARHTNELRTLSHLWVGLQFLYEQVAGCEAEVSSRMDPSRRQFIFGDHPLLADMPFELLTCTFHWYAVSSCNFIRLVGWLRGRHEPSSPSPTRYVQSVLPEVYPWRNKIAAHFARTDTRDTEAERLLSVCAPLGFNNSRFTASPFTLSLVRGGRQESSEAIRPWSLTLVHEGLTSRFGLEAEAQPGDGLTRVAPDGDEEFGATA